eukprot:m.4784 g.4784  ORF g.4784 m.4784 type:complete len:651 (+) comp11277_c0_seq1:41-1993(+)
MLAVRHRETVQPVPKGTSKRYKEVFFPAVISENAKLYEGDPPRGWNSYVVLSDCLTCARTEHRNKMLLFGSIFFAVISVNAKLYEGDPPRGWNSYDGYTCTVTEDEVKANADFMAKHLLTEYRYEYVVIDYEWFRPGTGQFGCCGGQPWQNLVIDDYGRLQPCPLRYPSSKGGKGFKPLADYVHGLGLKFGIHIMRGIPRIATEKNLPIHSSNYAARDATDESTPCSWCADMWGVKNNSAGQAYYDSLLELYDEWGVDFIKMDCAYGTPWMDEIDQVSLAIQKSPRDIVFSLSPTDRDTVFAEKIKNNVSMYRINGDVWDSWGSIQSAFAIAPNFVDLIGNPSFPDLDMLPFGRLSVRGGHGPPRQTSLTKDEQKTLMTLWTIFRNPLIMGGVLPDLANDSFTMNLIANIPILFMHGTAKKRHPVPIAANQTVSAEGWLVTVEECNKEETHQRWIINEGDGTIRFDFNQSTCLDVYNCGTRDGTPVRAFSCGSSCQNGKNQKWIFNSNGTIASSLSGDCLDVFNFAGPNVDTWSCNGGENQKWSYDNTTKLLKSQQTKYNQCLVAKPTGTAWTADSFAGDKYVALFNGGSSEPMDISVSFASIGISPGFQCHAYDLWEGGEGTVLSGSVHANVPGHGVALFNVSHCSDLR